MRFGFITCVRLGESCLEELEGIGAELAYLGTLHDHLATTKSGRVYIDPIGERMGVPVHKFRHINDSDAVTSVRDAELDWLYVIGWSQIAGAEMLAAPRQGLIGMHPTLLPVGRGRASIPWAIIKGLEETGVSMFQLDEGVDTGPLLGQVRVPIAADETSTTLYDKVAAAHRQLIRDVHPPLAAGRTRPVPQDESQATEWPGRTPADGELFPETMTVVGIDRMVRALTHPYPGAFVRHSDALVRVWRGQLTPPTHEACEIRAMDGSYWATDYDIED